MSHAARLKEVLAVGHENLDLITIAMEEIGEGQIEDEITSGVDESMYAEIATESREYCELLELRSVASVALESPGDNFKMAVMVAVSMERYGITVDADPQNQQEFINVTMETLVGAITKRLKSLKNRMQNFMGHLKVRRKSVNAFMIKNADTVTAAASVEPRKFTMTNGTAVNVAIGHHFDDGTIAEIETAMQVAGKLVDYVAGQDSQLRAIGSLSRSRAAMSAGDISDILRGNLIIECVPEIKRTVFPGNRVLTNANGMPPEFQKPTGKGIEWIGQVSNGNTHFFLSRLRKVKTETGPVTLSASSQKRIAEIAKKLPAIAARADAVLGHVSEKVWAIHDDHTHYDRNGHAYTDTNNAFMAEGGVVVGYLQTLWDAVEAAHTISKTLSLGLRQVMTNK